MVEAAKFIGGGLASFGLTGGAIGAGIVFGALILGVSRNPSLKGQLFTLSLISFSMVEALSLFSLLLSMIILFAL